MIYSTAAQNSVKLELLLGYLLQLKNVIRQAPIEDAVLAAVLVNRCFPVHPDSYNK